MTSRHIVAIDPALTSTGIVGVTCEGANITRVHFRSTITTNAKQSLHARLAGLYESVRTKLIVTVDDGLSPVDLVVEDPTDFWRFRGSRGGVHVAAKLGAAFGVIALAARHSYMMSGATGSLTFYPSHKWLRSYGGGKLMKHEHMVQSARNKHPELAAATDDEATAAALAITHHYLMEAGL